MPTCACNSPWISLYDVLDVCNAGFLDLSGNIVAFKTVLQKSLLDQECYFDWSESPRRSEVFDARKEKAGRHLVDATLVEGFAMDDLLPLRGKQGKDDGVKSDVDTENISRSVVPAGRPDSPSVLPDPAETRQHP